MKTTSSCHAGCILLAATLVGHASCQQAQTVRFASENEVGIASVPTIVARKLQDIPMVGLAFDTTSTDDGTVMISGSEGSSTTSSVAEGLIEALEQDDQVTGETCTRICLFDFSFRVMRDQICLL